MGFKIYVVAITENKIHNIIIVKIKIKCNSNVLIIFTLKTAI